ncbi:MAG: LytR C-terminal domain-containing protein [Patescibacteria group bacterium]
MDSLTIIFILNGVFFISFFLLKNIYIPLILSLIALFIMLSTSKKKIIPSFRTSLNLQNFTLNNSQYLNTIVCLIIFLILEKFIGFNGSLFSTFFIFAYLNKLDSRTSFFIALVLLIVTALFSIGGRNKIAEEVAVMVYYFLVVGVVWQIIEIRQEKSQEIDIENQDLEKTIINKLFTQSKTSFNFFPKKNLFLIGYSLSIFLGITTSYFVYKKIPNSLFVKKPDIIKSPVVPTITQTLKIFKNVPLKILNGTDVKGYAASAAATLRSSGWDKEFDISIDNYEGTASANILRYTNNLAEKIKLLEKDLKIKVTPIILNQASPEAEMILILGD